MSSKTSIMGASQGATTKASAAQIDVEAFGGVVTNIEKLLTPR